MLNWLIADARPELVKAIVAVEPTGPPWKDVRTGAQDRTWGITGTPLEYDPPVTADDPLVFERQPAPEQEGRIAGWLQKAPARRLVNLAPIPVLFVTAEASYHASFDHCSVDYLRQAGVTVDFLRLEDKGIHGNGHMMMLETNHLEIAAVVEHWLEERFVRSAKYESILQAPSPI